MPNIEPKFIAIAIGIIIIFGLIAKHYFNKYRELKHKYKSASVIHGKSVEEFIPFMKDYPYNTQNAKFIGMPIDLIQFESEKIVFIEVKTGKSVLSEKQENIKRLVENNQVYWETIRL